MTNVRTSPWSVLCATVLIVLVGLTIACSNNSGTTTTSTTTATERVAGKGVGAGALPPNSSVVQQDVNNATNPTQTDWQNFGWQTFVAVNWPSATPSASGISGLPNQQLMPGASSSNGAMIPTAWLTFRGENNTILPAAQDPGPWSNNPIPIPSGCAALSSSTPVSPGFQPMVLNMVSKFGDIQQASGQPLIDQYGWYVTYDIRLNQSEYAFFQQNGYYNGATQQTAEGKTNGDGPLPPPMPHTGRESWIMPPLPIPAQYGALEVKAAWRVLDPSKDQAIIPRYYTQWGYFMQQDGTTCQGPTLFGLIGLHILRLTPTTSATWFWATFEHVDNVTPPPGGLSATLAAPNTPNGACTSQYNQPPQMPTGNIPWNGTATPVNVCQVTNISSIVQQVNQMWQGNLAGTVWQYYQLIDVINPSVMGGPQYPIYKTNANVNTNILANTTMETYVQGIPMGGQSCMDCHAFAAPQGGTISADGNNQIFTFLFGNATAPPGVNAAYRKPSLPANVQAILQNMRNRSKKK